MIGFPNNPDSKLSGFSFESLRELLIGKILLLCHHNADPDAICSAFGVQMLIRSIEPFSDARIFLPGGASSLTRRIMDALGIQVQNEAFIDDYDTIVILDTATPIQLGDWGEKLSKSSAKKIIIDHHSKHPTMMKISNYSMIDESATSTCELVYNIYSGMGVKPTPIVARALLLGIVYDSRHFFIATPNTLNAASALLEIDGSIPEIFSMLRSERKRSERIARIKAAQRIKFHDTRGWILAASRLSSFHASSARALIGLGADASVVAGSEKGNLKASLRSTDLFYQGSHIHLGELAQTLGAEFDGSGSGHPTAAGINCKGDVNLFLERAIFMLSELLQQVSKNHR